MTIKLVIFVGTRPEIIRLSRTINRCRELFDTKLVHTGQNYDNKLNDVFFQDLEIKNPDYYLNCPGENLGETVGTIIRKSYELLLELKPDAVLILGDTNSCLSAYSAKRLKIPIFHIEAGNRCFDQNLPEEVNRKIIDHISDVNICYMEHARRNLISDGISSRFLFVTGSPMKEIFKYIEHKIGKSNILKELDVEDKNYFLVSAHREENIDNLENLKEITNCLDMLAITYNKKIIVTTHPRTRKMLNKHDIKLDSRVILSEPFGLIDYYKLMTSSLCVISDSGTITEEASILKIRAILLRTSTEHPEGIDSGNIIIGNIIWSNLKECIDIILEKNMWNDLPEYDVLNFSEKICNIILSYYSLINKFIWMK